jgi:hypothetical protein
MNTHFNTMLTNFVTGSDQLGLDHMAEVSASPTLLLPCTSLSAQSSSVFNSVPLTAFILYGIKPSLNYSMHFMLPKYAFALLRITFHALYDFEVISHL